MHKQYIRQSLSFICGVAPLLVSLDSTSMESHRNISMAPLLASLVSTLEELLASPPYTRSLSLISPYSYFILNFLTIDFFNFSLCIALIHFRGR